jgi:HAD superfamily hydrolase (TIGR01509 family)
MRTQISIALSGGLAKVDGIIFDMDGVISDTQTMHAQMESDLLRKYGIEMGPEEISREFAGVSDEQMFPQIFGRYGKHIDDMDGIIERKWQTMMRFSRGRIVAMPGALELVATLGQRNLPLAVASSSRRAFIELVLDELKILGAFRAVVSADEVVDSKPDPGIFLLAAKRLEAAPEACLVIEDSINGLRAARSAGMYSIGLVPLAGRQHNVPADLLVETLRDVPKHFR